MLSDKISPFIFFKILADSMVKTFPLGIIHRLGGIEIWILRWMKQTGCDLSRLNVHATKVIVSDYALTKVKCCGSVSSDSDRNLLFVGPSMAGRRLGVNLIFNTACCGG